MRLLHNAVFVQVFMCILDEWENCQTARHVGNDGSWTHRFQILNLVTQPFACICCNQL